MTEIGEILIEEEVEEVEVPEYDKFLKPAQVDALLGSGYANKHSVRTASDEDLIKLSGIGAATVIKLKEWAVGEVSEGDAISKRHLALKANGERLDVAPGDIIPAKFGAEEIVKSGKATWE